MSSSPHCFAYCRESPVLLSGYGIDLEEQKRILWRCYRSDLVDGWEWAGYFVDLPEDVKVPLAKRKAGSEMLSVITPGDVIIATRVNRMFQTIKEAVTSLRRWNMKDIKCWIPGDRIKLMGSPTDKDVLFALDVSVSMSSVVAVEMAAAKRELNFRSGKWVDEKRPAGFNIDKDRRLTPCKKEINYMRRCYQLTEEMSLRLASLALKKEKLRNPRTRKFSSKDVVSSWADSFRRLMEVKVMVESGEVPASEFPPYLLAAAMEESVDGQYHMDT